MRHTKYETPHYVVFYDHVLLYIPKIFSPDFSFVLSYLFEERYTWSGYEVPGMVLSRDLKGAMRLGCSKDMSVHASTCNTYDSHTLMRVVWKMWHLRDMCLYVSLQKW